MAIEYLGLSNINGPLVVLEGIQDAFFDEIVEVLEQESRDHPDENRGDRVELNRVYRLLRVVLLFEVKAQEPKAKENPDEDHDGIGVDKAKELRIHGFSFFSLR